MKKVIFICLLSISMCLSVPADQQAKDEKQTPAIASSPSPANETQATPPSANGQPQGTPQTGNETTNKAVPTANTANNDTQTVPSTPAESDASKSPNTTDAKPAIPKTNATIDNTTEAASKTPTSATTVKPDDNGKNKTVTPTTTVSPTPAATSPPIVQSSAFHGPSFIGGIILTLGLLAVGFIGFKYYKKQHAENYHTL